MVRCKVFTTKNFNKNFKHKIILKHKILDERVKIIDIHKDEEDIRLDVINLAGVELVEQILERIQ